MEDSTGKITLFAEPAKIMTEYFKILFQIIGIMTVLSKIWRIFQNYGGLDPWGIYIYIYIYRERERERMYTISTYVYIYIYIYTYRERGR